MSASLFCTQIFWQIRPSEVPPSDARESNEDLPYYDDSTINLDLEKQLRSKISEKKKSEERLRHLKERLGNDTEYFDEIPHIAVKSFKKGKHANFEKVFEKVIGMVGVKYTYKRDSYWRTWREVKYPNKRKEVICYTCQNTINTNETNCTSCHHSGFWAIEDKQPPCSFEIFSYKNNNELCVAHFWQLNNVSIGSCPIVMPYNELSSCKHPIVTSYLVTADYLKNVSERILPAICQEREQCEFSTVYIVNPDSIVFRVINSTNNVIYSKIMKPSGKNYVCVSNCGKFNFDTMTARRNEDHLVLNLLESSKKKRDNPKPKKRKQNKRITGRRIKSKRGVLKRFKSKRGVFNKNNLLVKKHKHALVEQPLERERWITTKAPSECRKILLKGLLQDLRDENYLFEK